MFVISPLSSISAEIVNNSQSYFLIVYSVQSHTSYTTVKQNVTIVYKIFSLNDLLTDLTIFLISSLLHSF